MTRIAVKVTHPSRGGIVAAVGRILIYAMDKLVAVVPLEKGQMEITLILQNPSLVDIEFRGDGKQCLQCGKGHDVTVDPRVD